MSSQTWGSKGTGMTKTNENLRKRSRIFHTDSIPTAKVNSVKKTEITTVRKRTANAGDSAMIILFRMFFIAPVPFFTRPSFPGNICGIC